MAIPAVDNLNYPTPDEALAIALTNIRYSYGLRNITINVSEGTELYERMKAFASLASVAFENNRIALNNVSPLDATDDELIDLAATYGVSKRPASSAAGYVTVYVPSGATITIPAGFVCTSPAGIQYKTTTANLVTNEDQVEVQAVSAGSDTDLEAPATVVWDSAAIGLLGQRAGVFGSGISGGENEDTEEELRSRLLRRLRFPSSGGNAAQVAEYAEGASAAIQRAFVYSAARGPSSYDVAIVRKDEDRVLSSSIVNQAANSILGNMPGNADLNCTSVLAQKIDVVIDMSLPLPVHAGGAGGGWKDQDPWPSDGELVADTYAEVNAVDAALGTITVDSGAADPPKVGDRFAIVDPSDGVLHRFVVQSIAGAAGAWVVTVASGALSFIDLTAYAYFCSADAVNLDQYVNELYQALFALGPGEKSANPDKIPRSLRVPSPDVEFPYTTTALQLTAVINEHPEILDMVWAARIQAGTSNQGGAGTDTFVEKVAADVTTTEADPPNIIVPRSISFRRKT